MDGSTTAAWTYANDLRLGGFFLGMTMVIFGAGMLVVVVGGANEADTADLLLAIGIFVLVFTVLLTLPRLRSRGAMSYSLHVERSMDDVEAAVRLALEGMGHMVRVEVKPSRLRRPPRLVQVDGVAPRFLLKAAPYREERGKGTVWTELVQIGIEQASDELARELRDRVATRLVATPPASD